MKQINVLITSVGRRSQLMKFFRKEFQNIGQIISTDCSEYSPAIYESDKHYIVPPINSPDYMKTILNICIKENISAIFSLIDPELSLLAAHKKEFDTHHITLISSSYEVCELCLDKYAMFKFCESNNILHPKTYLSLEAFKKDYEDKKISFPVLIKPQFGSASVGIECINDFNELEHEFSKKNKLLIQECLYGTEYGIDAYIDMLSGDIISVFIKEKIAMRSGETDKATSILDNNFLSYIIHFIKTANLKGQVDIDFYIKNNKYYLLEVNPRFGGGYPLAYECGCNSPKYICNNLQGIKNNPDIGNYPPNVSMLKQNAYIIRENIRKK